MLKTFVSMRPNCKLEQIIWEKFIQTLLKLFKQSLDLSSVTYRPAWWCSPDWSGDKVGSFSQMPENSHSARVSNLSNGLCQKTHIQTSVSICIPPYMYNIPRIQSIQPIHFEFGLRHNLRITVDNCPGFKLEVYHSLNSHSDIQHRSQSIWSKYIICKNWVWIGGVLWFETRYFLCLFLKTSMVTLSFIIFFVHFHFLKNC